MYGARAVLIQVAEAFPDGAVSVHVVWLPMVPGDDAEAARATGSMYVGRRVHQYYDEHKVVGLAYSKDAFPNRLREAVAAMPKDHPLYADLSGWMEDTPGAMPLWDAVLFYPPGVEWVDRAPKPTLWSKQVGFFGANADEVTGVFFRNDCQHPPVDSDWNCEVGQAMRQLLPTGARPEWHEAKALLTDEGA